MTFNGVKRDATRWTLPINGDTRLTDRPALIAGPRGRTERIAELNRPHSRFADAGSI